MPPKKKGGGKKKGKDKGKKKEPPPPIVVEEEPLNELSKELYLIQIRDLEQRITRYQTKCDHLQSSNDTLQRKLTQQLEDQEHIIALLNKKIEEQGEQCADLDDQLISLRHEKETERERLLNEISSIREDAQDRMDQLIAENTVLHGTLSSLEDFKTNKEKLESDLKKKQQEIEKLQKEFDDKIYLLEKQAVLDKERLRKEMVVKVNSVASEFRKVSDLQMADTTKRTIQENMSIGRQLNRMSDKTMELVRENEKLKEREKELNRRIEIMETSERDVTRKNIANQKILSLLREKLQEHETTLSEHLGCKQEFISLQGEVEESRHTVLALTQQGQVYKSAIKELESELTELQKDYRKCKEESERVKALLGSATYALKTAIRPSHTSTSHQQQHSDDTGLSERDVIISNLLEVLKAGPRSKSGSSTQLTGIASYTPGDLGLVPSHFPPITASHSTRR